MSLNSAYHDKMQAQLKELGAKLELYKAKAVSLGAEARVEIEKEIHKLQPVRENLEAKLEAARTAGAEKWEEVKASIEKAWAELSAAVEHLAHRTGTDKASEKGPH
jgi:hypothetical protein